VFNGELEENEKRDIREQVGRILRDLGNPEPPLKLEEVRTLLALDLQYYRSSDPGLLTELTHRFTLLARKSIPDLGRHLLSALAKSQLCAFWVPQSSRILVDEDVPKPRHRWIEAHEILHSVIPWHREHLLGDNLETVDPACRAVLELEANYGAGRLLSLQDRLASEARDLALTFASIKTLAKRYNNSIVSTFWRAVEDREPTHPVFGVISVHPHHPDVGSHDGPNPWRYYIRSSAFCTQFATTGPETVFALINQYASRRKTGPVFSARHVLADAVGEQWEFQIESFSTKHALLTFGYPLHKHNCLVQVHPAIEF
jgi:hypothetical protein